MPQVTVAVGNPAYSQAVGTPVAPHYGILTPPSPVAVTPQRVMLPAAQGATYEQLLAVGWTDVTLIQHGMMQA
jgi:hypothetical protein